MVRVENGLTVRLVEAEVDSSQGSVVVEDVTDVTVASAVGVLVLDSSSVQGSSVEDVVENVMVIVGKTVLVLDMSSVQGSSVEDVVESVMVIVGKIVLVLDVSSVQGSSVGRTDDVLSVHGSEADEDVEVMDVFQPLCPVEQGVSVTTGKLVVSAVTVVVMSKVVVTVTISRKHSGSAVVTVMYEEPELVELLALGAPMS